MWVSPRLGSWVVKASNFNTGTKPKYPTRTRIILNFSIFLSNFNTGAPPSIRQGLGYPEFFLPHSVGGCTINEKKHELRTYNRSTVGIIQTPPPVSSQHYSIIISMPPSCIHRNGKTNQFQFRAHHPSSNSPTNHMQRLLGNIKYKHRMPFKIWHPPDTIKSS